MSALIQAYSEFWTRFRLAVRKAGPAITCTPEADLRMECMEKKGTKRRKYSLVELICLRGVKGANGVNLDIAIDCDEYFDTPCIERPVRSSVHVHLLERHPMCRHEAKHLFGLRFDYDCETGKVDGEPLMHAHFDNALKRKPRPYEKVEIKELDPAQRLGMMAFKDCRVPTPRMHLPSVLCFVALIAKSQLPKDFVDTLIGRTIHILKSIKAPHECEQWYRKSGLNTRYDIPGWAWYKY